MLPNFLIIGAARSGTTTLYEYLQQHPAIFLPVNKRPEPHFFLRDREYAKGIDYYARTYFAQAGHKKAIGEASTSYVFGDAVPGRIKTHLPEVKLIVMLRCPADRTFSSYWHTVASGLEELSFEDAVSAELEGSRMTDDPQLAELQPYAYIGRSLYFNQLRRYLEHFPRDQLSIIRFEDFVVDPRPALHQIFRFIGVSDDFQPARLDLRLNASVPVDRELAAPMRKRLNAIFAEDVRQLSALLGDDFEDWLTLD